MENQVSRELRLRVAQLPVAAITEEIRFVELSITSFRQEMNERFPGVIISDNFPRYLRLLKITKSNKIKKWKEY